MIAQASKSKKQKKQKALAGVEVGNITERIIQLEEQMRLAAERLDFKTAIALRAECQRLKAQAKWYLTD